jgi:ABC-type glycerol-3-phosphate transport system permease component
MVAGTIVVMPLLVIYIIARKYILEGVAGGGVKG